MVTGMVHLSTTMFYLYYNFISDTELKIIRWDMAGCCHMPAIASATKEKAAYLEMWICLPVEKSEECLPESFSMKIS